MLRCFRRWSDLARPFRAGSALVWQLLADLPPSSAPEHDRAAIQFDRWLLDTNSSVQKIDALSAQASQFTKSQRPIRANSTIVLYSESIAAASWVTCSGVTTGRAGACSSPAPFTRQG